MSWLIDYTYIQYFGYFSEFFSLMMLLAIIIIGFLKITDNLLIAPVVY